MSFDRRTRTVSASSNFLLCRSTDPPPRNDPAPSAACQPVPVPRTVFAHVDRRLELRSAFSSWPARKSARPRQWRLEVALGCFAMACSAEATSLAGSKPESGIRPQARASTVPTNGPFVSRNFSATRADHLRYAATSPFEQEDAGVFDEGVFGVRVILDHFVVRGQGTHPTFRARRGGVPALARAASRSVAM